MVTSRGHGEYAAAPLRHGRADRHDWLRSVQLNGVGWAALLGLCLVSVVAGVAAAWAVAVPRWWGIGLGVLPPGAVVLLDRRRWAAMHTSHGWGGSEAEVARIAAALANQGVITQVHADSPPVGRPDPDDVGGGRDEPQGRGPVPTTASLGYRNRDADAVTATLRAQGIRVPELDKGSSRIGRRGRH